MTPQTLQTRRLWALPALLATLTGAAFAQNTTATTPTDPEPEKAPLKLEEVRVLGSRIRLTDTVGPVPVNSYDTEYIRATGALTLADFLKTLPQNYTGVPSGRASAPNEMNPESGLFTENSTPSLNFVTNTFATPLGQTGVSGVSLRGLGSGSTLVLVDGRRAMQSGVGNRSSTSQQGFVDLNTIPLGMVDHIELITDGASALYGADAVAGVINIVLKKNWVGNELSGTFKGTEHGGGRERSLSLTSGFSFGKLRGTVNVSYFDRSDLKGSQRSFTKDQNNTTKVAGVDINGNPVMGRDRRLNWGYPAVIQARTGTLTGVTDQSGNPTRFAIVRPGGDGTITLSDFEGVGAAFASGLVRGNTAAFEDLVPASERYGVTGTLNYAITPRLEAYTRYTFSDTRGKTDTQPGVSSASATSGFGNVATIIPAAFNPFGQDILVGMMHPGFGSIWQKTHTKSHNILVGLTGLAGETWRWDTGFNYQEQNMSQLTRNYNGTAITAALANTDASLRLNPFIDYRLADPAQLAAYERMAIYPSTRSEGSATSWDFTADGDLFEIWGGDVQLAIGANYYASENNNTSVDYSMAVTPVATTRNVSGDNDRYSAFSEVNVPLVGKANAFPLVRRLDVNAAVRYEDQSSAGSTTVPKFGLSWVPVDSLLLRASFSEGYRAPSLTEYQVGVSNFNSSLIDPRRAGVTTTGVVTTSGSNPNIKPETSTTEFYGLVYEPRFAKGLTFQVNYYKTVQEDVIQQLSAQVMVNNEAAFSDRITRAAPDAADTAAGQPGRITAVDLRFDNYGSVRNESLDFLVDYVLPWETYGRWRIGGNASKVVASERNLRPGLPLLDDNGDTHSPPEWNFVAHVFWNKAPWNAALFATYMSGFNTNAAGNIWTNNTAIVSSIYPEMWKFDGRVGYEFADGVWRGYGRGLRLQVGISNILDEEPPFADSKWGYNGALHNQWALGRSYELSFVLPF
jgi:iron complex outermembrane recepter protein